MSDSYRLMTIGPSHYCEKARWGLDFFEVDYTEDKHPPLVHWAWSLPSGGGRTVPILKIGTKVIALVESFRATAAGAHALRVYRDCR